MNKIKILFIITTLLLVYCATIQIGRRTEPLGDEVIERKVEMQVIKSPTIHLLHGEEITAYTQINSDFKVRIEEYIRKRHYCDYITTYKKYLPSTVKGALIIGGIGTFLGTYYLLAKSTDPDSTDYFAGTIGLALGLAINLPTIIYARPKIYEKTEQKSYDDKNFSSFPLKNRSFKVELKESFHSLTLWSDSLGAVRIPADSIIKLCPGKAEINITVRLATEPTVQKELIITSSFIASFRKYEELKRQEKIRLAKLEKEREKLENEIIKIITKSWTNKNKVCDRVSIYYRADSTVDVYYDMSFEQKKGIIDIVIYYNYGVLGAIDCFKTDVWMQFGTLAPVLFKKSYVKSLAVTSTVQFETNYGQIYPLRAVRIAMNRATAKKVDWVKDYMEKGWKIADSCVVDKTFEGFLITFLNDLYWEGWR